MSNLNDDAWNRIFKDYNVLACIEKYEAFPISSFLIKKYREPRLMAKFDHHINLPEVFIKNKLAILPVSRGDYLISHYDTYHIFENVDANVEHATFPENIQSINMNAISSETIAINCAYMAGILSDFLEEDTLYPTVSGRMGSGKFDYLINNISTGEKVSVEVENAQIEIDAAFEGNNSLAILEAKCDISDDFLVRQLYYPVRLWSTRITKKIKPVFFVYTNGIFSLYEYQFNNLYDYNSLSLVKHKNYSLEDTSIAITDIQEISNNVVCCDEPQIPFPQADSFERIINLCELLNKSALSKNEITEKYAFDSRQTDYYANAAIYLGLIQKKSDISGNIKYELSSDGKRVLCLGYKQRQLAFCSLILSHKVFNRTLKESLQIGRVLEQNAIVRIMKASGLYKVESESTFIRRSSTISGWINWILRLIQ